MTYIFDIDGTICYSSNGDFYIDDKGIKDEDFFNTGN